MPEPTSDQGLLEVLRQSFSRATSEWNYVHNLARQIEARNEAMQRQGVVVQGFRQTIVNRYHGVTNLQGLATKAAEGACWGYYFAMCSTLQDDVQTAGASWAKSLLAAPHLSVQGVMKATATGLGTTRQDLQRIEANTKQQINQQAQATGISVAVGASISSLLKRVGQTAKSEITRSLATTARRSWQVTGVLAIAFALGKVSDAMDDSGSFAEHLRLHRDAFNASQTQQIRSVVKTIREACE